MPGVPVVSVFYSSLDASSGKGKTALKGKNKGKKPGAINPRLALFEQPRHILQLAELVLILILGKPPQVSPVGGLVHIPGPFWYPAAKPEAIYAEGRRLQVPSR